MPEFVEQEPNCCCCASNIGLRVWASIVVVLNIVSLFVQQSAVLNIVSSALVIVAYGYLFYAVSVKGPDHLQRCSILLGLLVVLSIVLSIVSVLVTNWQESADTLNKSRPVGSAPITADTLRSVAWISIGISVAVQAVFAALFIGCIQQYKTWLIKMARLGSNPDMAA
jgi:hypothetical protein